MPPRSTDGWEDAAELLQIAALRWPEETMDRIAGALRSGILTAVRYACPAGPASLRADVFVGDRWYLVGVWDEDPGVDLVHLAVATTVEVVRAGGHDLFCYEGG